MFKLFIAIRKQKQEFVRKEDKNNTNLAVETNAREFELYEQVFKSRQTYIQKY